MPLIDPFERRITYLGHPPCGAMVQSARDPQPRSAIIRLVLAIARAGLSPLGQALVQFMIVWQR